MRRTLSFAVAFAATAVAPTAAYAQPACVGTSGTEVVCVDPLGRTYYSDCVYLGSSTCTPVAVNGPAVTCEGLVDCDRLIGTLSLCFATVDICIP